MSIDTVGIFLAFITSICDGTGISVSSTFVPCMLINSGLTVSLASSMSKASCLIIVSISSVFIASVTSVCLFVLGICSRGIASGFNIRPPLKISFVGKSCSVWA